jgi:glycerophosphoryl diester phosphodiesterase
MSLILNNNTFSVATLKTIASYAQGVGPNKVKFTDVTESVAKERVAMAKDLNLSISPYTFRSSEFSRSPFSILIL